MTQMLNPWASKGALLLWLAACTAALQAVPGASAATDSASAAPPKPSSFAPHHTRSHVYGAPVSKPILHKRRKRTPPAAPAPARPIK